MAAGFTSRLYFHGRPRCAEQLASLRQRVLVKLNQVALKEQ
jgi:hypothetical protein